MPKSVKDFINQANANITDSWMSNLSHYPNRVSYCMIPEYWGFSLKRLCFPGTGLANAFIKLVPGNKDVSPWK